uniref:Uncharacterized protein n=1 Tax=Tetraselmis chuii TaxID=63592 RepID=A0A7S1T1E2_9CHLO|mmetsp:Transcript_40483/g.72719  ORF Transcript_40483/g.72719 Transcript_40483/m.72719 type:complete len:181 (+) Transcript_40483:215-757(+)
MDPLAHLPAGSTDSSDSDRSSGAAQEDTGGIKKDAGGTADGTKLNLVTRKPTQGSDRRAAIDFATLSKYGYSAGDESLAESYQSQQAAKVAAERKRAREEEERRQREEAKLAAAVERPVVPQGERRAAALKVELATRVKFMVDTGTVLDTDSVYGDCAATEVADAAAAREANRAKRSKQT